MRAKSSTLGSLNLGTVYARLDQRASLINRGSLPGTLTANFGQIAVGSLPDAFKHSAAPTRQCLVVSFSQSWASSSSARWSWNHVTCKRCVGVGFQP